ncbi:MAG: site-specific DNA-methyltransferase [Candidatus Poribacteria bacterium]|nr:site-specific DNA-methyltransferase [Candidatus Poribacteria bacterium]
MDTILDRIIQGDCIDWLPKIPPESVHLFLSDIPYGIGLDDWDVFHKNTNSAYLGQSPAQRGKSGFKRRGKPIQGWNAADRNIVKDYQEWCGNWAKLVYPLMIKGASLFVFGGRRTIHRAIVALEDTGFLLRDILIWKKDSAHHRSQRLEIVLARRDEKALAEKWKGWRIGNLAPIYEPIAWLFKPYERTITDNIVENEVGGMNVSECLIDGKSPTNVLELDFRSDENRLHEAQKPIALMEYLIRLTTIENQVVLDPFIGSGTTAIACQNLNRRFIGFEINASYYEDAVQRLETETRQLRFLHESDSD